MSDADERLLKFLDERLDEDAAVLDSGLEGVERWHSPAPRVVMVEGVDIGRPYDMSLSEILERDFAMFPLGGVAVTDYDADAKFFGRFDKERARADLSVRRYLVGQARAVSALSADPATAVPVRVDNERLQAELMKLCRMFAVAYQRHPDYAQATAE
ncbi:DUF6221 family protein [Streptomyces sp. NPDC001999]